MKTNEKLGLSSMCRSYNVFLKFFMFKNSKEFDNNFNY